MIIPNRTGKNQTKVQITGQNVKPFSSFHFLSSIILILYSGWFFSNYLPPSSEEGWYYVSLLIFLTGPLALLLLYFIKSGETKLLNRTDGLPEKVKLLEKRILTALVLILLAMHLKICFIERYSVMGPSMEPKLHDGDMIWIEKISAGIPLPDLSFPVPLYRKQKLLYGSYKYGDIVIFYYPGMTEHLSDYFIKRIAALPGDHYRFTDRGLFINGNLIEENYLKDKTSLFYTEEYYPPIFSFPEELDSMDQMVKYSAMNGCGREGTVPENTVLVLGDNRNQSRDSRSMGFIPLIFIQGKLFVRE